MVTSNIRLWWTLGYDEYSVMIICNFSSNITFYYNNQPIHTYRITVNLPRCCYFLLNLIVLFISKISVADPIKLFFFANDEFFRFLLVSLWVYYIQKKIIDAKMTKLNTKKSKPRKKFYRIGYRHSRFELLLHFWPYFFQLTSTYIWKAVI